MVDHPLRQLDDVDKSQTGAMQRRVILSQKSPRLTPVIMYILNLSNIVARRLPLPPRMHVLYTIFLYLFNGKGASLYLSLST